MKEIVIKLTDNCYKRVVDYKEKLPVQILEAIRHGVVLPKGHGRIGDLDALEKDMIGGIKKGNYEEGYAEYFNINNVDDCVDCVRYAVTIIEADKMNKQIRADRE